METRNIKHKVKWFASLSNGETFFEGKGDFAEVDGELSPFQKLIKYTLDKKVLITSLGLVTENGGHFHLPYASNKRPVFGIWEKGLKPIDYNVFRHLGSNMNAPVGDGEINIDHIDDLWTVAEAVYAEARVQIWVNELNPKESRVLVLENE